MLFMRYILFSIIALAFSSCDLFNGPPYVTVLEGVAVDADTGDPLENIGVGLGAKVGNGVVRPIYVVDVTGADGRFVVADTVNISDSNFRSYEVVPYDNRRPKVYFYNTDIEPRVRMDQGDRREIVVRMRRSGR